MERCAKCGQSNIAGSYLCSNCGEILANQAAPGSKSGASEEKPLVCPRCKSLNSAGATVCARCGNALLLQSGLIGSQESGGRVGGRIKLEPSMFGEEATSAPPQAAKPAAAKGPSRLAQAAAKRERAGTGEETTPDWLAALRDGNPPAQPAVPTPAPQAMATPPASPAPTPAPAQIETNQPTPAQPVESAVAPAALPTANPEFDDYILIAPATPNPDQPSPPALQIGTSELPDWLVELKPAAPSAAGPTNRLADDPDLEVFNPDSLAATPALIIKPAQAMQTETAPASPKGISTEELGYGIPDWLRDLTTKNTEADQTRPHPTGAFEDRNKPLTTGNLKTDESIPNWLREATKSVPNSDGPSWGDVEIERTLNFAFEEETSFAPDLPATEPEFELPPLELELEASPATPANTHTGFTGDLADLPALAEDETPEPVTTYNSAWTTPASQNYAEYAAQDEAAPLMMTEDNDLGDLEPFSLPGEEFPDQPAATEIETGAATAAKLPPWGDGLAPWLVGLRPPALESEFEDGVASAEAAQAALMPDPNLLFVPEPEENPTNWLADMAKLSQNEENPPIGAVLERTETHSFSLREMLHQTEDLEAAQAAAIPEPDQAVATTPASMQDEALAAQSDEALEAELPDWLQNPPQPLPEQLEVELPDWLQNPAQPPADLNLEAQPATVSDEDLRPFEPDAAYAPSLISEPAPAQAAPSDVPTFDAAQPTTSPNIPDIPDTSPAIPDELLDEAEPAPDWLQDMMAGKPVQPVNTYGSTGRKEFSTYTPMGTGREGATDNLPEWLRDPAQPAPADNISDISSAGNTDNSASEVATNGLVADAAELLDEPQTAGATEAALLDNLFGGEVAEAASQTAPRQLPEWLQEQPRPTAPILEVPPDLPEWLRGPENDGATVAPDPQVHTDAVQNETATFGGLNAPDFLSDSDVPNWLRTATATPAPTATQPAAPSLENTSPDVLPAWLRAVGTQTVPEEAEEVGQSGSLDVGLPRVIVPTALAGAAVLTSLLRNTATPVEIPTQEARKPRLNPALLVRYLTCLALLAVILLGLLSPVSTARLNITPLVQSFYNNVESLSAGQKVLLVYDWEADKSGEMRPMAQAVTAHLLNKRAQLVTLSLNPQGPALAEEVTSELITNPLYGNNQNGLYDYGQGYLNLGFVPGSEAGVRSLFSRLNTLSDYRQGRPASEYPLMNGLDSLSKFNLIIVLAGDETGVRTWIEQFGITPGSKLLLGVPNAVGPIAQPYAFAPPSADANLQGQLVRAQGLVVGLNGATQYQQLLEENKNLPTDSKLNLNQRLTAQSLGALLLVVIIVVANIVYFLRKRD